MRASILVLGPLLARAGEATVSLPGGCAIGNRPIDLHLKALQALGAEIELAAGYVRAIAPKGGLVGGTISFSDRLGRRDRECADGGGARQGHQRDRECGARAGDHRPRHVPQRDGREDRADLRTDTLTIEGVDRLHGATYAVMPDRIEAGSYACAALITGGSLELVGARRESTCTAILGGLHDAGALIEDTSKGIKVSANGGIKPLSLSTAPFPAFPTDMQAQFMAMLSLAEGTSLLTETIFENRYMHVPELNRMGADIEVRGRSAVVRGVDRLVGAPVMATDLRASMSLILAGLAAEGETQVHRVYHLDRGYERLEEKLQAVGADIERVSDG